MDSIIPVLKLFKNTNVDIGYKQNPTHCQNNKFQWYFNERSEKFVTEVHTNVFLNSEPGTKYLNRNDILAYFQLRLQYSLSGTRLSSTRSLCTFVVRSFERQNFYPIL
jgi:hypothetical protein